MDKQFQRLIPEECKCQNTWNNTAEYVRDEMVYQ